MYCSELDSVSARHISIERLESDDDHGNLLISARQPLNCLDSLSIGEWNLSTMYSELTKPQYSIKFP